MKLYRNPIKSQFLLLAVLSLLMLIFTSCDSTPGVNQEMFGITKINPVGTFDNIRSRIELAGLTYKGTDNSSFYQKNYPGSAVHKFEHASDSAIIIIGPDGHVINTGVHCFFESSPCSGYLEDLMKAYGFDLTFLEKAKEEFRSNNLESWYKWHKSSSVAGVLTKYPQAFDLSATDREFNKK